ncbi:MAG: hypothetical protein U0744_02640 [Gemmataceae bacterium]
MQADWSVILSTIATGAAGLILAFFAGTTSAVKAWFKRRTTRKTYGEQMGRYGAFTEELEALKSIKPVDQVVVLRGHNCGGLPNPGKPYTVHAIQGWQRCEAGGPCLDPTKRFQRGLQVDAHYARMLEDVVKQGVSIQVFEKMPAEARLRGYFELDGVRTAHLYFLGLHDDELIFVSVASKTDFDTRQILEINDRVTGMRSIIGSEE